MRRFLILSVLCCAFLCAGQSRGIGADIFERSDSFRDNAPIEVPMDEAYRAPLIQIDPYTPDLFAEEAPDSPTDLLANLKFFEVDEVRRAAADYERIRKAVRPTFPVSVYHFGGVGFAR